MNAIDFEKLTKCFEDNKVFKGLNLNIVVGEFYALMGPYGSGKTTLASIIASIRKPSSRSVLVYGQQPEKAKKLIGYNLFTAGHPGLTVTLSLLLLILGINLYARRS